MYATQSGTFTFISICSLETSTYHNAMRTEEQATCLKRYIIWAVTIRLNVSLRKDDILQGGEIYTATLVSVLNEDPKLSYDSPDLIGANDVMPILAAFQYAQPLNKADLAGYPNIGKEVEEWKEGINFARSLARSVGMEPEDDGNVDSNNDNGDSGAEH
ncbi:hypothetical protein ACROYT_G015083 [Oculina patagonica]